MLMLKFVPKTAMSFVQLQATKLFQPGPQATPLFLAHNEYQQRRIDFPPPAKTTNRRSKAIYSLPFVPPRIAHRKWTMHTLSHKAARK